jgi:hypothetical protein
MSTNKVIVLHTRQMRAGDAHWYLSEFLINVFTVELAAAFGRTALRTQLVNILDEMDVAHPLDGPFEQTAEMGTLKQEIAAGVNGLKAAVDYFSGPAGTDAERAATEHVRHTISKMPSVLHGEQKLMVDAVADRLRQLQGATLLPHTTAIHQQTQVQTLLDKIAQFNQLYFQRGDDALEQEKDDNMTELKERLFPLLNTTFELFEAEYQIGSDANKALAITAIDHVNVLNKDMNTTVDNRHHTATSGGGGHKPKPDGPNGPSTDENRPEGVPPNEEGDEPDNGGDSSDNNNGDNNGGNSGGSDNNENPPSGGNNGGSDKPPNPESPD